MPNLKPIKRHPSIQPLSREHHQGLLLSWKIKKGLSKNIESSRIANYVKWFYKEYLLSHFEAEEEHLFPILDRDHPLVIRALKEHEKISELIQSDLHHKLTEFESLLDRHIRFEERKLFNEIQTIASEKQLLELNNQLSESDFCHKWEDEFWKE